MKDKKMAIKFGTSGWRAVIAEEFTFENVARVISAIGKYVKAQKKEKNQAENIRPKIVVGYDTRFLSKECARFTAEILAAENIDVFLADRDVPTPVIAYQIIKKNADGGINFTASHNPPEYNGIKFSPAYGGPAPKKATDEIEKIITKNFNQKSPPQNKPRPIIVFDASRDYLKRLRQLVDIAALKKAKLKIIIDCMHGTCRGYLDNILQKCTKNIVVLNNDLNPAFGGNPPEPKPAYIKTMIHELRRSRAHLGLACDGDADRFGIIDRDGTYINANQVLALLFEHLIKTRGKMKTVARTLSTTSMIDGIAGYNGMRVIETPVGFKYIGEVLAGGECLIGGEESGGLSIHGHVPEKDGILACLLIAEMLAIRGQSIRKILNNLYKKYGYFYNDRIDIALTEKIKLKLLNKLKTAPPVEFCNLPVKEINTIDGFKFILQDQSWVMYRFSGTEPIVRCYLETISRNRLKKLRLEARRLIVSNAL
ncbi:MAG: phosphoglucomutase/phosphomannomutase family protein [Candidatus Omnitrophota bacterium]